VRCKITIWRLISLRSYCTSVGSNDRVTAFLFQLLAMEWIALESCLLLYSGLLGDVLISQDEMNRLD